MNRLLDLFGLAKRAGMVFIGQDKIFEALKNQDVLIIFISTDCSKNVMRKFLAAEERGAARIYEIPFDRSALGSALGTKAAQAVAFNRKNGFAEKALRIFNDERGGANE